MDSTLALLIVGIALVGVAIWRVKHLNARDAQYDMSDALDEFRQVIRLVEQFAPAADQLMKIGQLAPEKRAAAVIDMVQSVLPNADTTLVRWILESWVATEKHAQDSN